ncbi:hypothetical protein [Parapedomonas caeni]|jgi:hypothetical protein
MTGLQTTGDSPGRPRAKRQKAAARDRHPGTGYLRAVARQVNVGMPPSPGNAANFFDLPWRFRHRNGAAVQQPTCSGRVTARAPCDPAANQERVDVFPPAILITRKVITLPSGAAMSCAGPCGVATRSTGFFI